jgi:hypothetical protein
MKFCPVLLWKTCVSSRAWMSVPPPGGKGTRIRTVFSGHCWARAGPLMQHALIATTPA